MRQKWRIRYKNDTHNSCAIHGADKFFAPMFQFSSKSARKWQSYGYPSILVVHVATRGRMTRATGDLGKSLNYPRVPNGSGRHRLWVDPCVRHLCLPAIGQTWSFNGQCQGFEADVALQRQTWCTKVHTILCHTCGAPYFWLIMLYVSSG